MMERNINTYRDDTFRDLKFDLKFGQEYILVFFFSNSGRWRKCDEYQFIIITSDSIRLQVKTSQFAILKNVKLEKIVFK